MTHINAIKISLAGLSTTLLLACGGGGGSGNSSSISGQFIDSPVEGVSYVAGSRSGITSTEGRFNYARGDNLSLSIGDIDLGSGTARNTFTPLTLVNTTNISDATVINIARFLQTLDDDGDPDNGILITEAVRTAAAGKTINFAQTTINFENDGNVQTVIAELTALTTAGARSLVTAANAETHLRGTLNDVLTSSLGTYSGTSVNQVSNCSDSSFNRTNRSSGSIEITSINLNANGASFTGNGSFTLTIQGSTLREDFSITGSGNAVNFTGDLSGSIRATAFIDGFSQGSENSSFTGKLDGNSLTIVTPARLNQDFGFVVCDLSGSTLTLSK